MKIKIVQPNGEPVSIDWLGKVPDFDKLAEFLRGQFPYGKISIENMVCIGIADPLRREDHIVDVRSKIRDVLDKYLGADPMGFSVFWNFNRIKFAVTLADLGITQSDDINVPAGFLARVVKNQLKSG